MDYIKTKHSKHCLMVHLIFVCKYRKKILVGGIDDYIKQNLYGICNSMKISIVEMESDKDHIHLLIKYPPTLSILQIVRKLKQITTYRIWRSEYRITLQRFYWKEHTLWSDGYFSASIGQVSEATIRTYIQNQG